MSVPRRRLYRAAPCSALTAGSGNRPWQANAASRQRANPTASYLTPGLRLKHRRDLFGSIAWQRYAVVADPLRCSTRPAIDLRTLGVDRFSGPRERATDQRRQNDVGSEPDDECVDHGLIPPTDRSGVNTQGAGPGGIVAMARPRSRRLCAESVAHCAPLEPCIPPSVGHARRT